MSPANPSVLLAAKLIEAEQRIAQLEAEVARLRSDRSRRDAASIPAPSSLLESITDAFIALDKDFRYVWINAEAERLLQGSRAQMLGKVIWDLFPEAVGSELEQGIRKALAEKVTTEFENYYAPWNCWFWNKAYPTSEGGLAIYWRDITAQKTAQAELQRQALVLSQVHDSIITTDLSGNITGWNHGAEQITGYAAEEVVNRHISLLYFDEDRPEVGTRVLEPLFRLGNLQLEMRNRHKSGREFFLRLSLSLLRDEAGQPYGMIGVAIDITDAKLAERALRMSEQRYRCLADAMPQIAYTSSPDGKTQFVNHHWYHFSGANPEECLDLNWLNWIHPDDAPDLMSLWQDCVRTEELFQSEYRLRSANGEYRWQLSRALPVRDDAGQLIQWVGTLTDIHDRKTAEDALRQSEERFRLAVEAFEGIVYDWNLRTGYVQRIGDVQAFLGISESAARPTSEWWEQRVHPDDLELVRSQFDLVIAEGRRTLATEYRIWHEQGHWIHVSDHSFVVLDENGRPARVVGSSCDITDRKRLEAELADKADRLAFQAAVLATTTDAVIVIDPDEHVTYCNPAAERLYGIRAAEAIGQPLSHTYRWLNPEDEKNAYARLASIGTWSGENIHQLKNGDQIIVHSTVNVVPAELGGGLVAVIRDVSERKQAELALQRQAFQLERANEDLLHFAYSASHDLQTPLRTISNFSQLLALRYRGKLDDKADDYIHWIVDASARMSTLLNDLVRFAQAAGSPADDCQDVPLESALADALENLRGHLEEARAAITHDPLPIVPGVCGQFSALFQNLIGNSLKYRRPDVAPHIHISAERRGGEWLISLHDNGIGFKPQFAEKVFGVFQRLHGNEYAGTGIGLAICRKIVERWGGRIWATAVPGEGAVFSFLLPAVLASRPAAQPSAEIQRAVPPISEDSRHFDEVFQLLDFVPAIVRKLDGTITIWTRTSELTLGWTKQEAIGRNVSELLATEYTIPRTEIEAQLYEYGTWTGELKKRCKGGNVVWLATHWMLRRDGSGRPESIIEVYNDITALKHAEHALLRSIEQRDLALRAGKMGIWQWELATGVVEWGEPIEVMLGMSAGTFGRTFDAFMARVHPDDRALIETRVAAALASGPDYRVEFRIQRMDGRFIWLYGQGQVSFDTNQLPIGMSGVVWEITGRE